MSSIANDIKDFIIAFIAAFLFIKFLGLLLATPMPVVSVVSDSMLYDLHRGDMLVLTNHGEITEQDIIVYLNKDVGYPIIHRVVGFVEVDGEEKIITKGDNNERRDCWSQIIYNEDVCWSASYDDVKGKAILAAPVLGYPKIIIQDPIGFFQCDVLGMSRLGYCQNI